MKCTAAQAVSAFAYWLGYYEKASAAYATSREKDCFEKNKGSANFTYAGQLCGVQGQPWCAAQVSTAIYDACGMDKNDAAEVMYGLWPYVNCAQLWDAAPTNMRGRRGYWNNPKPGDVIIFTDNGTSRDHTGMVYAVDGTYVYTYEGNSSNMCRKRSYLLTSSYIYGYVRPLYKEAPLPFIEGVLYGAVVCKDPMLHLLSKGCAGPEVKTIQRILYSKGVTDDAGGYISADGDFGKKTEQAVKKAQKLLGLEADGKVGGESWPAMLKRMQ